MPDHTTGTERGRMLVVNGGNIGDTFYESNQIEVGEGEAYAFSIWVSNVNYATTTAPPKFEVSIEVKGSSGVCYYKEIIDQDSQVLAVSPTVPKWVELGSIFGITAAQEMLQVIITSEGGSAGGNDFAFDDLQLIKLSADATEVNFVKTVNQKLIKPNEAYHYDFLIDNQSEFNISNLNISDTLLNDLTVLSITTSQGVVSYTSGGIDIIQSLSPSQSMMIGLTVTLDKEFENGTELINKASLSYDIEGISQPILNAEASVIILNPSGRGVLFI